VASETPNIRVIHPDKGRRIAVTWKGGAESVIDLSQHLADYAVFASMRSDDDLFRKVQVGEWLVRALVGRYGDFRRHSLAPRPRIGSGVATDLADGTSDDPGRGSRVLGRQPSYLAELRGRLSPPTEDCETSRLWF
jgi:hypothetical protein